MIVVDTNVLGYLLMDSPRSAQSERILEIDPQWIAPILWRSELRNVLAKYLQAGYLQFGEAISIMERAEKVMHERAYAIASPAVLALANESGCTAYDCEFVVLARDLAAQLVTVDRQLLTRFPETAISPEDFLRTGATHRR